MRLNYHNLVKKKMKKKLNQEGNTSFTDVSERHD